MSNFIGVVLLIIGCLALTGYLFFRKDSFINVGEICKNYWNIFNRSKVDQWAFVFIPICIAIGITTFFPVTIGIMETISTTMSILLGLLFATLGALSSFRSPDNNSIEKKYNVVFNETVNLILFLSFLSVAELFIVFIGIIVGSNHEYVYFTPNVYYLMRHIGGIAVYGLAFSILLNCLVVFKRISRLIIKDESLQ